MNSKLLMFYFRVFVGSFNMNTKLNSTTVEELTTLLESSEYTKKMQSNGFSE